MKHIIEYRVRPVTRYIITKFESVEEDENNSSQSSTALGEYQNSILADKVATSLYMEELGHLPVGTETIVQVFTNSQVHECVPKNVEYSTRLDANTRFCGEVHDDGYKELLKDK